jgi:hypothetical protein
VHFVHNAGAGNAEERRLSAFREKARHHHRRRPNAQREPLSKEQAVFDAAIAIGRRDGQW